MSVWNKIRVFMAASACLLLMMLLAWAYARTDHEKEIMDTLFFECTLDGQKIQLGLWQDETEETYYLFLPSCFAGNNSEFVLRYADRKGTLKIDGVTYRDGDVFGEMADGKAHQMELQGLLGTFHMNKSLKALASEKVPAVMITVEDEKDLLSTERFSNKKYIETGDMVMLDEEGSILCSEELAKFKVRGNLTATLDKKPFTFSFYQPVSLCGMAPAIKWNLLANATDGSYIRNKVALDLANACIDAYEPDGEFIELYLNRQYQGLYLLTEAVEIGENRLELFSDEGWFLEMELDFRLEEDTPYVVTDRGQIFVIHGERGVPEREKEQLQSWLNDIESALSAQNGISPQSGKPLGELLDLESWAETWLIQEISGNHDTGIASQFAYAIDKTEPFLYAGPVWDFDGTMGNVNTAMFTNPAALTASIEESRPQGNPNQNRWLAAMYQNEKFRAIVEEKYTDVFRKNLEEIRKVKIDGYVKRIGRPAELDMLRWNESRLGWMFVLPKALAVPEEASDGRAGELESHVSMVKGFLEEKKNFLDRLWIEHADFCIAEVRNETPVLNQDYNQTLYFWVEKGTPIRELSEYEKINGAAFYYRNVDTGEVVTDTTAIWTDCVLEAVWKKEGEP